MRRFLSYSLLLLLLLAACAQSEGAGKCADGICVKIRSIGSIKKNTSIPIEIKIKVDKNEPEVTTSMTVDPGIVIEDVNDKTNLKYKDKVGVTWKKKMNAGEEYTILQNVNFTSTGIGTITVVGGVLPNVVVRDSIIFIVTEEGGTAYLSGTPLPPITPEPLQPGQTPTFFPTYTLRPLPSPTATELPPTPTEMPLPTETLPAYP